MTHHRGVLSLASLACLLAAGSCATTVTPSAKDPGVDPPKTWTSLDDRPAPAGPVLDDWIAALGDETLTGLVREALAHNRDLQAAAARMRRAAAAARVAGADRLPQVGAGLSGRRQRTNFFGLNVPGATDGVLPILSTTYGVSLDVAWEVDLWGRLREGERAALADREGAAASYAAARLSVAGQTAKIWFDVVAAREQLALAEQTLASYETSLEGIERRYRAGIVDALDVRLARTNVANGRALVAARQRQLDVSERQLEILIGRYPAGALETPARLPDTPAAVPAGLPADLVDRRPDVLAARFALAAADARTAQARKSLYPRLSLTASGGTSAPALRDLLDGDFKVWSLVGNLTQPIFQGGRLRANVDLNEAQSDEALAQFAGTLLEAYGEVEIALDGEQTLREREDALAVSKHEADAALRLAEARYREGLVDILSLLETQRRALAARGELITVRRERLLNRIDLHLALGGGFRPGRPDALTSSEDKEEDSSS